MTFDISKKDKVLEHDRSQFREIPNRGHQLLTFHHNGGAIKGTFLAPQTLYAACKCHGDLSICITSNLTVELSDCSQPISRGPWQLSRNSPGGQAPRE